MATLGPLRNVGEISHKRRRDNTGVLRRVARSTASAATASRKTLSHFANRRPERHHDQDGKDLDCPAWGYRTSLISRIAFKASTNMLAASLMFASEHEAANGGQPTRSQ